jgi:hypothetical protein
MDGAPVVGPPRGCPDGRADGADLILGLQEISSHLRQAFRQGMSDFGSGSDGITRSKFAPASYSSLGTCHVPHHEVFSRVYPSLFHVTERSFSPSGSFLLPLFDDNSHIGAEDHAILALSASILVNDVLGANESANVTIDDAFTGLPQYVDSGQFPIPLRRRPW